MGRITGLVVFVVILAVAVPRLSEWYLTNRSATSNGGRAGISQNAATVITKERTRTSAGRKVVLPIDQNGHFYTTARLNKKSVKVMVDTGSTAVALTAKDARKIGIYVSPKDFTIPVRTANGLTHVAPAILREVRVGGVKVQQVDAVVLKPGQLNTTLLGMAFLNRLKSFSMRNGELVLTY